LISSVKRKQQYNKSQKQSLRKGKTHMLKNSMVIRMTADKVLVVKNFEGAVVQGD